MQVLLLKSKIHRARITGSSLDYQGSLTIDLDLMDKCGLLPYEKILCSNLANGARFETYAIPGARGSGNIVLNGAAARLGGVGDLIIVMSFTWAEQSEASEWKPKTLVMGENNKVIDQSGIE
ncbi:MAG: aspartate 1-decarboxylase [Verrucomicrobia bacterium]|nr:aspartate 1-decarboxylase [Verrucomicrobiota bacterium]MCF7707743.1 aspartate 1-decarboxylase [Verrucomicrobiota bacterium]